MIHSYETSRTDKSIETENTLVAARDWGGRRLGRDAKECEGSFWGNNENVKLIVMIAAQL